MKKKKKNKIESLILPYRNSAEPLCPFFGECGGCMFQDVSYDNQLNFKKDYLNSLFEGSFTFSRVEPSLLYGYRNRMDYVCAFGKRGLRRRGKFKEVVDLASCPLLQPESLNVWQSARKLTEELQDYDFILHSGILRYIVLRQAYFTKETMCNFVLNDHDSKCENILESINADSKSVIIHSGLSDISFGEVSKNVLKGFITEDFDGIKYRIYPNSFFQSNSECALKVYRKIREACYGRVLDLYCGVGSISLFAAGKADHVTGVEIVQEAVSAAEENMRINEIENANFICADSLDFIKESKSSYNCVILDPPRTGVHPKVYNHIRELNPERIIYMSCNPSSLKDELRFLENYTALSSEAFDMFPQTPHVETLTVFDRKK